ncbi:MAG: glycosyltransferase family A protein [Mobilitalea sp.]
MLKELYAMVSPWGTSNKFQILRNRVIGRLTNWIYPCYCICTTIPGRTIKDKKEKTIVSMTSFPARIVKLHLCVESILRQTVQADEVILWLAAEQFNSRKNIPKELLKLETKGLQIRFCKDIRAYKKIFFTAQEYADVNIITADDDVFYPEDWIEQLLKTNEEYPAAVCCYRANCMTFDENNQLMPYRKWKSLSDGIKGPSSLLLPTGVGGVLYPSHFFDGVDFNYDLIRKLCPTADDLWLKTLSLLKNIEVVKVDQYSKEWFTICDSQKESLMNINVTCDENDIAFQNLIQYYGLTFDL